MWLETTRVGNWQLHLAAFERKLSWFHAYDSQFTLAIFPTTGVGRSWLKTPILHKLVNKTMQHPCYYKQGDICNRWSQSISHQVTQWKKMTVAVERNQEEADSKVFLYAQFAITLGISSKQKLKCLKILETDKRFPS